MFFCCLWLTLNVGFFCCKKIVILGKFIKCGFGVLYDAVMIDNFCFRVQTCWYDNRFCYVVVRVWKNHFDV